MGITNSKGERSSALKLCRERKRFIKQAIDSRYALAAAHVSYVQSLRNIGTALRRFAEAEVLVETSLSTSATELDKTPSPSSYPSPSPSHLGGVSDSPVINGSPLSTARVSYMKSGGASALTVKLKPRNSFVEEGEFTMPPPPPPPPDESGWDYFDPADESFRFPGENGNLDADDDGMYGDSGKQEFDFNGVHEHEGSMTPKLESPVKNGRLDAEKSESNQKRGEGEVKDIGKEASGSRVKMGNSRTNKPVLENDICTEREDPSEFITHRAKDFLSSIKDIDSRFFRASESGREVSRMLEANKIHVGYAEARGNGFLMPR